MEGSPVQFGCTGFHSTEAFSCRNIFGQFLFKKVLHQLTVYVLFYLKDSTCLKVPFRLPSCKFKIDASTISGETTHLLLVTHKFPAAENVSPVFSLNNFQDICFYRLISSKIQ